MVASFAVIKSSGYYTRQSEAAAYYAAGQSTGVWLRGHERLGVAAGQAVTPEDFDRICAGVDADGNQLVRTRAGTRMLGVDITCAASKAFSVLWGFSPSPLRRELAGYEVGTLGALVEIVDREIPLARRGHNGVRREHGRFVVAAFSHSEARPEEHTDGEIFPDMQRHHHLCWPNVIEYQRDASEATDAGNSWGAIDSVALRRAKKMLGALFRLHLSSALQARGFAIQRAEDGWSWTIAGVPAELVEYFSARRKSLEQELAASGLTSAAAPALASAINSTERRAKLAMTEAELTQRWHGAARSLGYEPEAVIAAAFEAGRAAQAEQTVTFDRDAVLSRLTEHDATFSRPDLIEAVANGLVGTGATAMKVIETADALVAEGRVVVLAETRDGPVYSTPSILQAERDLVEVARHACSRRVAAPLPKIVESLLHNAELNPEQEAAIRAATAGRGLVLLQGGAGTGKSTTLNATTKAWQSAGCEVVVTAVTWRAATELGAELGVAANAMDSLLAAVDHGTSPLTPKTVVLVEEGGLQSTRQALRLLEAVDRAGGVALIVGDENQLRPVGAGHAMRLLRETVGAVTLKTIVRQRESWAREAPLAFARGDARAGLQAFADHALVHMSLGPRATVEALADRWQQIADASPGQTMLLVAKTNAEVRALSAAVRSRLRERGLITGPDFPIEAADASGSRYTLRIAVGDRVRFLRRDDALAIINGTEARVTAIGPGQDGALRIEAEHNGRALSFTTAEIADARGRARLVHAYASTIFFAQGVTVDRTLALLSSRLDRRDAYVVASRARETTEFFIDQRGLDRELSADSDRPVALELSDARMAYLAERLARPSVKANALDFVDVEQRQHVRRKEFAREL